ncbi:MAG TPA: VOC family protein [Anaerolineales bacterium]|nr:VOC family protein [Anaerolineales bacterium]
MTDEIYPMPSFPMLIVKDLDISSRWYQEVLGFKHIFTMPGPGGGAALVHLRWVKYADLLIARSRDGKEVSEPKGSGVSLNFSMFGLDRDIDTFAKQAREQGANVSGPVDQPWNVREVTVLDPDGYKLVFTVPININMGFDKVIERARNSESK